LRENDEGLHLPQDWIWLSTQQQDHWWGRSWLPLDFHCEPWSKE
jgi:hypothetical protein